MFAFAGPVAQLVQQIAPWYAAYQAHIAAAKQMPDPSTVLATLARMFETIPTGP